MRISLLLISAAFVSVLTGCGSSEPYADSAKSASSLETRAASNSSQDSTKAEGLAQVQIKLNDRQIVRTGDITVRVPDVEDGERKAQKLVHDAGGFISDSSTSNLAAENSSLEMTARVPVTRFDDILASVAALGTVEHKSTAATDVTGQVADMDARLKVMRAQEDVYLRTMKQTSNMKDVVTVQDQLMQLRERIEGTEAQLKAQREQAAYSTLKISLVGTTKTMAVAKANNWVDDSFVSARNGLMAVVSVIGRFVITLAVFAPVWIPLAIGFWWWRKRQVTPPPVIQP